MRLGLATMAGPLPPKHYIAGILILIALAIAPVAQAQAPIVDFYPGDAEQHLLESGLPTISTPWRQASTLAEQVHFEVLDVQVIVDEAGVVTDAVVVRGPVELRNEARTRAMTLRYRPFQRAGQIVRARFEVGIAAMPADYRGPADRTFPATTRGADVTIRLVRTECYGSCHDYELEISGNGDVRYVGRAHVAREGEHRWTIPPERVAELVEIFRRADYFNLRGYYMIPATHLPFYLTSIRIGDQEKFVVDYGSSLLRSSLGEARSTTVFPGARLEDIAPASVAEIENAIDRIAGVGPWVGSRDE